MTGCPLAQPFVELVAIDHPHEPVTDRHPYRAIRRRNHSRSGGAGDQQAEGDVEVLEQAGRHRAAARLDPTRAVEQQHLAAGQGEIVRRRGTGRSAAYDDDVEALHPCSPR